MGESAWWEPILKYAFGVIAMTLVMGWIAGSRMKKRKSIESNCLRHPPSTLVFAVIAFVFFGGIAILSNVYANRTTTWWTTTLFVALASASLVSILDYFVARHEMSESGMSYGRLCGPKRSLRWSELRNVRYAPFMRWFRLETTNGEVARISSMLMGLPEFARLVLRHAPPESIEEDTLSRLRATANGNPPPVW